MGYSGDIFVYSGAIFVYSGDIFVYSGDIFVYSGCNCFILYLFFNTKINAINVHKGNIIVNEKFTRLNFL